MDHSTNVDMMLKRKIPSTAGNRNPGDKPLANGVTVLSFLGSLCFN
jgi:hypothetical protein